MLRTSPPNSAMEGFQKPYLQGTVVGDVNWVYTPGRSQSQTLPVGSGVTAPPGARQRALRPLAPVAAVVGDVLMADGDPGTGALQVALGNGRVFGYHVDAKGACVLQPVAYVAGWRVAIAA
ncbi:hypothetical protein [Sphingomonas quercus]|uniref:Uncharacterized protein n=1 Tax=Sphingomonas quercus TaxID=2842451 RepID=A0ABS6BKF7_9SPHN|nr:hypothetical protein [Sphingomonas quercus]MBU3077710.1 hypothetical protein [Sphingomonas quercus]